MTKSICLVDANSIGNANHNASKLSTGDMETQAIYGSIWSARNLINQYPTNHLWLWDDRARWRFEMYPQYKSNRKPKDEKSAQHKEQYKLQQPYIKKALTMLGIAQMQAENYEADDLAGWLSGEMSIRGFNVILVTGDMDWAQLVNERTVFHDPIRDKKINIDNFFEMTGFRTPEFFLDGKVLVGDSSDCITPVGGIGKKTAPEFVAEFQGVKGFLDLVDSGKHTPRNKKEEKLAFGEGRSNYERNMKLMRLIGMKAPAKFVTKSGGAFNPDEFKSLCLDLNFMSIVKDFENFIEPFERLADGKRNRN